MGRPRSFSREELLEKAMPLFWKDGFADSSLQSKRDNWQRNSGWVVEEYRPSPEYENRQAELHDPCDETSNEYFCSSHFALQLADRLAPGAAGCTRNLSSPAARPAQQPASQPRGNRYCEPP